MLGSGTTACVDFLCEAPEITLETLEPVVHAYRDAGMRATILLGVADKPFAESLPLHDPAGAAAREAATPTLNSTMALARAAVDRSHEPGGQSASGWVRRLRNAVPTPCSMSRLRFAGTAGLCGRRTCSRPSRSGHLAAQVRQVVC